MQPDFESPPGRQRDTTSRIFILLLLILGVLIVVFAVVNRFESRRTPGWQSELGRYLRLAESFPEKVKVVASVEAANPQNFSPDRLTAVPTDWTWGGIRDIPQPTSVQCVRLEGSRTYSDILGGIRRWEVVLIGYHDDGLWHSGWLVHEINYNVGEQELQEMLALLGCDLGLDNLQAFPGFHKLIPLT